MSEQNYEDYKPISAKIKKDEVSAIEKKISPVVSSAKKKKRSVFDKIFDVFISENLEGTRNPSILGVIIPEIKKTVLEVIDVFLHPDGKRSYTSRSTTKISYRDYYNKGNNDYPREEYGRRSQVASVMDYDNVVFDSRGDAEMVLQSMDEILSHYGVVSIADYYELCDIDDANYTTNKYGWKDIRNAQVVRVGHNEYKIKLPRAMPLEG